MRIFPSSYRFGILFVTFAQNILFESAEKGRVIHLDSAISPGCYLVDITQTLDNVPTLIIVPHVLRSWKCCGTEVFRDSGDSQSRYRLAYGQWSSMETIPLLKNLKDIGYNWVGFLFEDQITRMVQA